MRIDRLITLGLVQPFRRTVRALHIRHSILDSSIPILMYHSISDSPEPGVPAYYQTNTSPAVFREQIRFLAENGYQTITLEHALKLVRANVSSSPPSPGGEGSRMRASHLSETNLPGKPLGERLPNQTVPHSAFDDSAFPKPPPSPGGEGSRMRASVSPSSSPHPRASHLSETTIPHPRLVVLTFDDGYRDFYTQAFPILQEFGFTATVFLPTAFIGEATRRFRGKECLVWNRVIELRKSGIEFGSHTVNHPKLVELGWAQIERELRDSKAEIEERLRESINTFCYPFAFPQANQAFANQFSKIVKSAGYSCCATTTIGQLRAGDDAFALKRLPINSLDDTALLRAKLEGAYDWLSMAQSLFKRYKTWAKGKQPVHSPPEATFDEQSSSKESPVTKELAS